KQCWPGLSCRAAAGAGATSGGTSKFEAVVAGFQRVGFAIPDERAGGLRRKLDGDLPRVSVATIRDGDPALRVRNLAAHVGKPSGVRLDPHTRKSRRGTVNAKDGSEELDVWTAAPC